VASCTRGFPDTSETAAPVLDDFRNQGDLPDFSDLAFPLLNRG
jgi:hypothetical protein